MTNIAIGLFLIAALIGIYMASKVLRGVLPPAAAAVLHGLFGASGLVLTLYAIFAGARSMPLLIGGALVTLAALGGFVVVSFHLRNTVPPKGLVIAHAGMAVLGVGALLVGALGLA